jgi:hypothetical protein
MGFTRIALCKHAGDATISITDKNNSEAFRGNAPSNLTLQKISVTYRGKKSDTFTITKYGYEPRIDPGHRKCQ